MTGRDERSRATGVLLVGGAPGVGKTTLAKRLAQRRQAVPLTVDDAQVAAAVVTTPESHPELHHIRRGGGAAQYFTATSPERLISDSLERESIMRPVVQALIRAHRGRGSPVVMDWWLLRPADVVDMADVESLWIHLDPAALWRRERRNADWLEGSTDPDRMLANFMARSLWRNDLVADQAEVHGLPLLRLDGTESAEEVADQAEVLLSRNA